MLSKVLPLQAEPVEPDLAEAAEAAEACVGEGEA